ncbi:MAG TPA: hypothetical protein PLO33_16100 [Kouleothrix sp.]|uniref:hypothetical protein n=1 Tax=Kouleothrix sp. TaxID=2779161 RepID=UPI002C6E0BE5|nr:hypothetical protein [Kouleothrix sp.]HRC77204.1 hypothetical protein [Kouleothrix sp.]
MGRKSRVKRDRREQADFTVALTACEGTWLERMPSDEEHARIRAAQKLLEGHRAAAAELSANEERMQRFSLEVFRDERFTPLHFDDWVVAAVLEKFGEPPVSEDPGDTAFTDYLRAAVQSVASARVRRALASQVLRFLPDYAEAGLVNEALAISYNAYTTVMSDANTPLLVQMLVGGLSRWYDEVAEDEPAGANAE